MIELLTMAASFLVVLTFGLIVLDTADERSDRRQLVREAWQEPPSPPIAAPKEAPVKAPAQATPPSRPPAQPRPKPTAENTVIPPAVDEALRALLPPERLADHIARNELIPTVRLLMERSGLPLQQVAAWVHLHRQPRERS